MYMNRDFFSIHYFQGYLMFSSCFKWKTAEIVLTHEIISILVEYSYDICGGDTRKKMPLFVCFSCERNGIAGKLLFVFLSGAFFGCFFFSLCAFFSFSSPVCPI